MQHEFEYLDSFIGTTFHQDYDIFGQTLERIVASYKSELSPEGIKLLLTDINAFLEKHKTEENAEFDRNFYDALDWGLVEGAFGEPRDFLTRVAELLANPESQQRRAS